MSEKPSYILGVLDAQKFKGEDSKGASVIGVLDLALFLDDPRSPVTADQTKGFYILRQQNDSVVISREQIQKLVEIVGL